MAEASTTAQPLDARARVNCGSRTAIGGVTPIGQVPQGLVCCVMMVGLRKPGVNLGVGLHRLAWIGLHAAIGIERPADSHRARELEASNAGGPRGRAALRENCTGCAADRAVAGRAQHGARHGSRDASRSGGCQSRL